MGIYDDLYGYNHGSFLLPNRQRVDIEKKAQTIPSPP
jgi:hypothetical protein